MIKENENWGGRKPHILWIDLLRSFAICSVILVHVLDYTYAMNLDYMSGADLFTQVCAFTLFTVGRLGVPVFLFITGYLMLDRPYDRKACVRFWKKNWLGLLVTTEVWIVLYDLFLSWYNDTEFSGILLLADMIFVKELDMPHMWYMEMILGIYPFIPFVAMVLQKCDWKILRLPMLMLFLYFFGIPTANVVLKARQLPQVNSILDLSFSGGVYGFMLILGYFSKKGVFRKIRERYLYLTAVAGVALTVILQMFSYHHDVRWNAWYSCIFVPVTALCIFEIVSRKRRILAGNLWKSLAECSFGIYLVHYPLLMLIKKFWKVELIPSNLVIVFSLTLAASWGIVLLLGRIPGLGKLLFFHEVTGRKKK